MSALATEYNAVNLGQGFPDYAMNEELIDLVNQAMRDGFNQYVPMQGYRPLCEALSEKNRYLYRATIDPDKQITITPGGTYAIYTALTTVLQPGDEVIIFEPAYDSYIPNVEVNGAIPVLIDLKFPEYKIDWSEVRQKISSKTKMIMLNSPHNPTGAVLSEDDVNELRSIVSGTNILSAKNSYLSLSSFMQKKRDYFVMLMKDTKFNLLESKGSYFICARYDRISNENDKDFSVRITKEYGVTTIPVSVFYRSETDNKVVRFCFAKKNDTLEAAVERLAKIT